MNGVFKAYLRRLVCKGRLEVESADGAVETFGDGTGPVLGVKLLDHAAEWKLMLNPALALGELYMDGRLIVTKGDLYHLLELGAPALAQLGGRFWGTPGNKARNPVRDLHQGNNRRL